MQLSIKKLGLAFVSFSSTYLIKNVNADSYIISIDPKSGLDPYNVTNTLGLTEYNPSGDYLFSFDVSDDEYENVMEIYNEEYSHRDVIIEEDGEVTISSHALYKPAPGPEYLIDIPKCYDKVNDVTIAFLDTKIDFANDYFKKFNTEQGPNFTNSNEMCHTHGFKVAATTVGEYGVIQRGNVKLLGVPVFECNGGGRLSSVVNAINSVVNMARGCNTRYIISFTGTLNSYSDAINNAIKNAYDNGVLIVMPAGNTNTDICHTINSPYRNELFITGASQAPGNEKTSYSGYGSCVDLYLPGKIQSYDPMIGGPVSMSGTSVTVAQGSALAALQFSRDNDISPQRAVKNILTNTESILTNVNGKNIYSNFLKRSRVCGGTHLSREIVARPLKNMEYHPLGQHGSTCFTFSIVSNKKSSEPQIVVRDSMSNTYSLKFDVKNGSYFDTKVYINDNLVKSHTFPNQLVNSGSKFELNHDGQMLTLYDVSRTPHMRELFTDDLQQIVLADEVGFTARKKGTKFVNMNKCI